MKTAIKVINVEEVESVEDSNQRLVQDSKTEVNSIFCRDFTEETSFNGANSYFSGRERDVPLNISQLNSTTDQAQNDNKLIRE